MDHRTKRQFEFIELVAAFEGVITSRRLREHFDITMIQSSRVIANYREIAPHNLELSKGEGRGRYRPTNRFKPEFSNLVLDQYFTHCNIQNSGITIDDSRQNFTEVDFRLFNRIHQSMRDRGSIKVFYRSMNNPKGLERVLHPLAFAFAGKRWHLRAYDERTESHRDFNLARLNSVEFASKSAETPEDTQWNTIVQIRIHAHPDHSQDQQQLIRDEFFNGAMMRSIHTRDALKHYIIRELEVAVDLETEKPPAFQLALFGEIEPI